MISNFITRQFNKSNNNSSVAFQRALTTSERSTYNEIVNEAFDQLKTTSITVIGFDSHFPSQKQADTGIGTALSRDALDFMADLKDMLGLKNKKMATSETGQTRNFVNLQLEPQGNSVPCPYESSVFSFGTHIIDLVKLTQPKYENILDSSDSAYKEMIDQNPNKNNPNNVDFGHVVLHQKKVLHSAFQNFNSLPPSSLLKQNFETFKTKNDAWLKPDALYEILSEKNNDAFWPNWSSEIDKNLFNDNYSDKDTISKRISELESTNKDDIEFYKFCQFIATEQLKESKQNYNDKNIDLVGDCLLAFSTRDQWANKAAFVEGAYLGCPGSGSDPNQYWGFPALDTSKLSVEQPAGKLLKRKFDVFFDRYDGARIDAAWGLITPWVYKADPKSPGKNLSEGSFDNSVGDKIIKILLDSASAKKIDKSKIYLELLGKITPETWNIRDQYQFPMIGITQYGDWYSPSGTRNPNLRPERDYFAHGTHDHYSIAKLAHQKPEGYVSQKNSELIGSKKPVFTLLDILGDERIINDFMVMPPLNNKRDELKSQGIPEDQIELQLAKSLPDEYKTSKENWTTRISDFERIYHQNLTNGKGLNIAESLKAVLEHRKLGNPNLLAKLEKAAALLKSEDKEANTKTDSDRKYGAEYNAIV